MPPATSRKPIRTFRLSDQAPWGDDGRILVHGMTAAASMRLWAGAVRGKVGDAAGARG